MLWLRWKSILSRTDGSFVVWRVHLERMGRQKKAARTNIKEDEDRVEIEIEVEEVPPGRTCFSPPPMSEELDLLFPDSVDEPLQFEKPIATPSSTHPPPPSPSSPSPAPTPPAEAIPSSLTPPLPAPHFQPNPAFYPKCAPRFYSVVWTGGHNIGINGEYLLPDLDYPGRVLLSESTFQAWRQQNLHAWQNNQ